MGVINDDELWEYNIAFVSDIELNCPKELDLRFGLNGWQLCSILPQPNGEHKMFFKRKCTIDLMLVLYPDLDEEGPEECITEVSKGYNVCPECNGLICPVCKEHNEIAFDRREAEQAVCPSCGNTEF